MVEPLPNELIEDILDNLYFDKATLLNCALVGRAWVRPSQRGIFREIILEWPAKQEYFATLIGAYVKATARLDSLFAEKPYLASYVRSLELRRFIYFATDTSDLHTATVDVVRRLSNVNNLSFVHVRWECLSSLLQAALAEICKTPSVTRFSTFDFYIPRFAELASLLSHMGSLRVLDAGGAIYYDPYPLPNILSTLGIHPPRSIQLDELGLSNGRRFIDWFQQDSCPFGIRNLKSFEIPSRAMDTLQYFGTSITELTLHGYYPVNPRSSEHVHLRYTPNLRKLSLLNLRRKDHSIFWIKALFEPLLNSKGNIPPLQHLTIGLCFTDTWESHRWLLWVVIDRLFEELSEKPEFVSFETVHFKLGTAQGIPGGVSKLLRDYLPFLEESGKLVVEMVEDDYI
ncbi:hypothetical protein BT96DRAFT_995409 [Gymnopus androsaceus JB14]|uniref:F-box domain-containing protein n=1 Tax=Gymnopus androsaceus JB14 TaxID=1447944 RepID=A0A6A4HJI7_9AGAR|nr:hypothetical protein BT96DRAFT_995409 [Gymnopus androsaceus JB14]